MKNWDLDVRQANALDYFQDRAAEWRRLAEADREQRVSTIWQRNDHALDVLESQPGRFVSALDLGCGTGELVIELARRGLRATGIDFSDRMIELGREKATRSGVAARCTFEVGSVMDYDFAGERYSLVTAFGFIGYLRPEQLPAFFAACRQLLDEDGVLQVGSRNRLFNVVSMNQFTRAELGAGTILELLEESVRLCETDTLEPYLDWASSRSRNREVLKEYPQTDVEVAGYQYTSATICNLLQDAGLRTIALSPVHYHGFVQTPTSVDVHLPAGIERVVSAGVCLTRGESPEPKLSVDLPAWLVDNDEAVRTSVGDQDASA